MKLVGYPQVRWPGGSWGDIVAWNNTQCSGGASTTDQAIAFISSFGAHMQPIVNFSGYWCNTQYTHNQAVSLAAQWVTYMNVTNHYAAQVWEIGNEDYGSWEQGHTDATTYGNEFADYYNAMKAVDSTILIGAVAMADNYVPGWTVGVLSAIKAKGLVPDYLIVHDYPFTMGGGTVAGPTLDKGVLDAVGQIATFTTAVNGMVSQVYGAAYVGKIPYRMTEFQSTQGAGDLGSLYVEAMFDSQLLLELASNGWVGANKWDLKNGLTSNYNPVPDYYTYYLLSQKFGASQVAATSANASLRAYAAKDTAGNLTLFLVNNDPATDIAATVNVAGFGAAATGTKWVLLPAGNAPGNAPQEAVGLQINGVANPGADTLPTLAGVAQAGTNAFTIDLPPSAMVMMILPPG